MKTIETKIKELLAYNDVEPVYDFTVKGRNNSTNPLDFDNIMKTQENLMDELKTLARANNTLLGRTMRFPMADSYALYVVTKVNKTTVEVTWVKWCDAWQDDRLGYQGSLSLQYATQNIKGRDALDELFSRKKAEQQS